MFKIVKKTSNFRIKTLCPVNQIFLLLEVLLYLSFGVSCSFEWSKMAWLKALGFTLLPQIGGIAGGFITKKNIPNWYEVSFAVLKDFT